MLRIQQFYFLNLVNIIHKRQKCRYLTEHNHYTKFKKMYVCNSK